MSFLIAEIAFLLLLAASLGGLLAWWLARRSLEEVTVEQVRRQDEWRQWRQQIEHRLAERPDPDWTPLMQRLGVMEKAISGIRLPMPEPTNLRPVLDAVASMRVPEVPRLDLEPLLARLQAMEASIKELVTPAVPLPGGTDLSGLIGRLDAIDMRLARLRIPEPVAPPDLQPLMASMLELQRAVATIRAAPPATVQSPARGLR